ncbi:hypothetical protein ACTJJE_24730 [Mycolicibacterium sp. 22603]|uniref:hypothetical protein n=1 Tax=Mycolicibacterium sp. 22603 TaxID=3453950 RepID=UPI003F85CE2F
MRSLIVLATAALISVGCSSRPADRPEETTQPAPSGVPTLTDQQAAPERVLLEVTIAGGQVTPTNEQLQARVGEPILIRVTSDVPDELHVHATPEHSFEVTPGPAQTFQFTVEVPGKVDVELHEAHRVVATIAVQ